MDNKVYAGSIVFVIPIFETRSYVVFLYILKTCGVIDKDIYW
ncbi:MAG: hypothetical protein ACRD8U_22715 [Pyrinomonadaceae bacterium]